METPTLESLLEVLPPKQQLFVRAYLANGLNASKAYRDAGYSSKSENSVRVESSKLLAKPNIQAAVQAAMDKRADKLGITAEYVLNNIVKIGERCMQAEPVYDKEGNPTGEYTFNANGALKAQELLGRNLKLFTDKIEVEDVTNYADRMAKARKRAGLDG